MTGKLYTDLERLIEDSIVNQDRQLDGCLDKMAASRYYPGCELFKDNAMRAARCYMVRKRLEDLRDRLKEEKNNDEQNYRGACERGINMSAKEAGSNGADYQSGWRERG